jgi:hypothetical protein
MSGCETALTILPSAAQNCSHGSLDSLKMTHMAKGVAELRGNTMGWFFWNQLIAVDYLST